MLKSKAASLRYRNSEANDNKPTVPGTAMTMLIYVFADMIRNSESCYNSNLTSS